MKEVKFIVYLMMISSLFIQCTNDSLFNSDISGSDIKLERKYYSNDQQDFGYEVTKNDAIIIAQNYFDIESEVNGEAKVIKEVKKIDKIIDLDTKEVYLYIIQYKKGFCIVSADSRFEPILAYSNSSNWVGDSNAGSNLFLNIYKNNLKDIKNKKLKQSNDLKVIWKKLAKEEKEEYTPSNNKKYIDPDACDCPPIDYCDYYYSWSTGSDGFVHNVAQWGQYGSFNYYSPVDSDCDCEKKDAGCGPIALGMLMRFHKFPLLNMTYNGDSAYTDYENMPLNVVPTCGTISGGAKSSAMLVRLAGSAMNSMYGPFGMCATATPTGNIGDGLEWFGYTHDGKGDLSDRKDAIINDLKNYYPVILSGAETILGEGWHIWLADGYKESQSQHWLDNETCQDVYKGQDPYICGVCPDCVTCYYYSSKMWHMNWGQNGGDNGYYSVNTNSIGKYDQLLKAYTNIRKN